jgi:LruC domain-containing protein
LRLVFETPIDPQQLGVAPFDPYLIVTATDGTRADVHLPGYDAFPDRSPGLPVESGPSAFIHTDGSAWALLVPTAWRFPMEGVPIRVAYPQFEQWQQSGGQQAQTWYLFPSTETDHVSVPIEDLIPQRDWTLEPPLGVF